MLLFVTALPSCCPPDAPNDLFDFAEEVDSAKLASLMSLGFEEAAARAMLIQCGHDVEAAAAKLFAKQSASS
ncbi:unnamed protein product [Gongylonema pulchrum]|uniref:UBA domain-containing protein n=1 Tax=Gongylonema pulchrum TaxID=637853 RepID=A0A183DCP7_9BILA|nr:unnamed protein product [Gongylonema pulchrum]